MPSSRLYIVDVTYHIKTIWRDEFGYVSTAEKSHPKRQTEYHVFPYGRPDLVEAQIKHQARESESYEIHSISAKDITCILV